MLNGFYLQPKLVAAPALVEMYSHFGLSFLTHHFVDPEDQPHQV